MKINTINSKIEELKSYMSEINYIKKMLIEIKLRGNAPVNLYQFRDVMGLVEVQKFYKVHEGKTVKTSKLILTEKGERILSKIDINTDKIFVINELVK